MDIRLLKLSNNKGEKDKLTSQDILSIHLGYFIMNGKVTYSTDKAIAKKPDYVILVLGNSPVCYWCHVLDLKYHSKIHLLKICSLIQLGYSRGG